MSKRYLLECCVDSAVSAANAQKGGADRLELCANLPVGGTTPTLGLYRMVQRCTSLKVHVLVRCRGGNFCYTKEELETMREDVALFRQAGADGIVIGALRPDGALDEDAISRLMDSAGGMSVTLHRAFDLSRDGEEALETAVRLGINTILTSGQRNSCEQGANILRGLAVAAGNRLELMAGGGVNAAVVEKLLPETGIRAWHMSGKKPAEDRMLYHRGGVSMGAADSPDYVWYETEEEQVRAVRRILDRA